MFNEILTFRLTDRSLKYNTLKCITKVEKKNVYEHLDLVTGT